MFQTVVHAPAIMTDLLCTLFSWNVTVTKTESFYDSISSFEKGAAVSERKIEAYENGNFLKALCIFKF